MKKLIITLLLIAAIIFNVHAQENKENDLIHAIMGKWKVIKHQTPKTTSSKATILIFEPNGTFIGDSTYFGTNKGFYRTDESRGTLILENGGKITEWNTTVKKGVLRMRSAPTIEKKQGKIYITSVRTE